MNISAISFKGSYYAISNKQLDSISSKNAYLMGLSTAQYQKKNDCIKGADALYLKINDKKQDEFVRACKYFKITPQKVNI